MLENLRNSTMKGCIAPLAEIQPRVSRNPWRILQVFAVALLWLGLYRQVLVALTSTWWVHDALSYGFLVLPISLFVAWTKRQQLAQLPVKPAHGLGVLVTGMAAALLMVSEAGAILLLAEISLIVMLWGLVLALLGTRFLKALWFPLGYLCFLFPILGEVVLAWNWEFQLLTARMGVLILQSLSIPAHLDRNYIILPRLILKVASSCSGAHYLISILALAIPLAYLTLRRIGNQMTLVLFSLVIGIVANWIRVVFIGLWAYAGGEVVHGPFHMFQAISVAWVGYAGLLFCAWGLVRAEKRTADAGRLVHQAPPPMAVRDVQRLPADWTRSWAIAVAPLVSTMICLAVYQTGPVPLKRSLASFPSALGKWKEFRPGYEPPLFRAEKADEELHKIYLDMGGHKVHLYVAYFQYQKQEKEAVSHLMRLFHRNGQLLRLASAKEIVVVNRCWVTQGSQPYDVVFWYDFNGRLVANELEAKSATIWDAFTKGRTNGALVMIYSQAEPSGTQKCQPDHTESFALEVIPTLRNHLPS
jgi:EpsI family protein